MVGPGGAGNGSASRRAGSQPEENDMAPEKRVFEISEQQAKKQLAPGESFVFVFDITNSENQARNAGVDLIFEQPAPPHQTWFKIEPPAGTDKERIPFEGKQMRQVKVTVTVPANADTKDYTVRLMVWDVLQKSDVFTEGNWVTTEVRTKPETKIITPPPPLWLWILLAVAGLAIIGGLVSFLVLRNPKAMVPNVTGKSLEEATKALGDAGFKTLDPKQAVTGAEPGRVVDQDPAFDTEQPKSTKILLTIEAPQVEVPEVTGKTVDEAKGLLPPDLQIAVGESKWGTRKDTILAQDPKPGAKVRRDATVKVEMDKGPQPPAPVDEPKRCAGLVQGKIAWDRTGNKNWDPQWVERLCRGTSNGSEPPECFRVVMQGGINWPVSGFAAAIIGSSTTQWQPTTAVDLCEGTNDAGTTIICFQNKIKQGSSAQSAISACSDHSWFILKDTRIGTVSKVGSIFNRSVDETATIRAVNEAAPDPPESVCYDLVQDKIAWNDAGSTRWNRTDLERLCAGTSKGTEPAHCFDGVMHGGVDRGGGTTWHWTNAVDLCAGTDDSDATIRCFRESMAKGKSQREAIGACRRSARGPA